LRLHQYGEAGSVGIVTTRVKINSLDKLGGPPLSVVLCLMHRGLFIFDILEEMFAHLMEPVDLSSGPKSIHQMHGCCCLQLFVHASGSNIYVTHPWTQQHGCTSPTYLAFSQSGLMCTSSCDSGLEHDSKIHTIAPVTAGSTKAAVHSTL
jgi:hypothetical protein